MVDARPRLSGKGAADFFGYVTGVKIIEQIFERRHLVISCACVDTVADRYVAHPLAGEIHIGVIPCLQIVTPQA